MYTDEEKRKASIADVKYRVSKFVIVSKMPSEDRDTRQL
jgi:hypothetical protein